MGVCGGGRGVLKGVEFVGKTVKYMNSRNTSIMYYWLDINIQLATKKVAISIMFFCYQYFYYHYVIMYHVLDWPVTACTTGVVWIITVETCPLIQHQRDIYVHRYIDIYLREHVLFEKMHGSTLYGGLKQSDYGTNLLWIKICCCFENKLQIKLKYTLQLVFVH